MCRLNIYERECSAFVGQIEKLKCPARKSEQANGGRPLRPRTQLSNCKKKKKKTQTTGTTRKYRRNVEFPRDNFAAARATDDVRARSRVD